MKRALLTAAVIGFMLPAGAHADECADAEDQATMNECAAKDLQAADAELNSLYHQIRQRIVDDVDTRNLLRDAERAWVAFRDAECTFATSSTAGGSIWPMEYDACLTGLTQQRIEQFQGYLSAQEGDLGPLPPAE